MIKTLTITVRPDRVEYVRRLDGEIYLNHTQVLVVPGGAHWQQMLRQSAEGLHHFDRDGSPVFEFALDEDGWRHPLNKGWHVVGRYIDGERQKYARVYTDAQYDAMFARKGYLPRYWAGFHGGTADIVRVVQMKIIQRRVKTPRERTLRTDPTQLLKRADERGSND